MNILENLYEKTLKEALCLKRHKRETGVNHASV